ncbi:MAG: sortase, partial [Gemmiger sp.]|nr:sortase [Gemmiger sp.]
VTLQTHYGSYTYQITETKIADYRDETTYDFTRNDENLILYTCYPFDALGFTADRYFVYASLVSGPVLDANS